MWMLKQVQHDKQPTIINNLGWRFAMKRMALVVLAMLFVGFGCSRRVQTEDRYQPLDDDLVIYSSGWGGEQSPVEWVEDSVGSVAEVTWHPSGTLLKDSASANVYVIKGAEKHWIKDEQIFSAHGWTWSQVIETSADEMACYDEGLAIGWEPDRIFFKVNGTELYLAEKQSVDADSCAVYPIASKLALQSWGAAIGEMASFDDEGATQEFFSKCALGVTLFVRAGSIVKPLFSVDGFGPGVVLVADGDGVLRPFASYEVFAAMGYETAPMLATADQSDFYASFAKFGDAISMNTAALCANVDGLKTPGGIEPQEQEQTRERAVDGMDDEEFEGGQGGEARLSADEAEDVVEQIADDIVEASAAETFDADAGASTEPLVECTIACPIGWNAWVWYGAEGELSSAETLKIALTKEQICERGFPWLDYNCAAPNWSAFDPMSAKVECNHSFVNHKGVVDANGEGELFFDDVVCYQWKPPVAKSCGKNCVALSAYYLFRADFAVVMANLPGTNLDFATAAKVKMADDEYYHFVFGLPLGGEVEQGNYQLQYATLNQELAYFGADWIEIAVDDVGNVEIVNL
jgi:hypothetical protein